MEIMSTYQRPLLLVGLIFLWTLRGGESTVCVVGHRCILPCTFLPGRDTLIHWMQMPNKNITHSYYDNKDQLGSQIPSFQSRTSLFQDQISRGNASLLLMWVKVEDQGQYMCYSSTDIDNSENFIELKVEALIRNVNIKQVNDTITCSSERIYPEPELSWSTNPPSPMRDPPKPEVQLMEDGLYKISSTIVKNSTALSYSCTVSAGRNKRKTTLFKARPVTVSAHETTIFCPQLNTAVADLTWKFNQAEIILNRTVGADDLVSDSWKHHVKNVSQSGDLTLQHVSSPQEGTYTCDLSNGEETYVTITALTVSKSLAEKQTGQVGIIVGIIVGVIVAAVAAGAVICYCKKNRAKDQPQQMESRENGKPDALEMRDRSSSDEREQMLNPAT
ncbi:HERV-H LTR-associating protein 2 isoform X2 [Takifugu flavidus]|uniref:HERV-H LTR-associating protein 2 isoform X2 n=1 Tax=Takifugu flavidus TaxID=433684 RepID=UPI00254433F6|nr:HERV-H LTR-associating protein 2 isoform X2 [Takifugu flavidus]